MNTRAKVRMLVPSIAAAALLGATVILVAQQASPAVTSVAVCVKSSGQVRLLMGASTACATSEQRVDWVVGGEVTDITAGEGLTASRQGGAVQLAVNPTLLQKDRIFSGFNDGPAPIPFVFSGLATLDLPAGDFVILAKMTIINEVFGARGSGLVQARGRCRFRRGRARRAGARGRSERRAAIQRGGADHAARASIQRAGQCDVELWRNQSP
jgi:hypothetical protein